MRGNTKTSLTMTLTQEELFELQRILLDEDREGAPRFLCLGGLPTNVKPVLGKTKAAKKIITVDGCPFKCARKVVEQAGFKPTKSIVLTRDINMKRKGLSEDIGKEIKGVMEYISDDV